MQTESVLASSLAKVRTDVLNVTQLRLRLQHILNHGVLSRYSFRRIPALRALLSFLDALPCDTADALAFTAPVPPAIIGGVVVQSYSTDRDDAISIPTVLLRLHLSSDAWNPDEELERQSNSTAALAAAAAAATTTNAGGMLSTSVSGSSSLPASPLSARNASANVKQQQIQQQNPIFSGAVTAVEVELAWRVLQGVCILSPSQKSLAADERLFEAAMTHINHALSVSPLIESELLRSPIAPTGSTMHQLSVLRVALAAIPAVEVSLRRSVASLRLAISSGFVSFLFSSVLGNASCCKSLRTAALDLISTTLWDCHYCVPRGVVALLSCDNISHQQQQQQQQQQQVNLGMMNSNPSTTTETTTTTNNISPRPHPETESSQNQNNVNNTNNNINFAAALATAASEATAADCEVASAISSLITVIRAELALLQQKKGNNDNNNNNNNNNLTISGGGLIQTVDEILFQLIHLRDPSGVSFWGVGGNANMNLNTVKMFGTSSSNSPTPRTGTAGSPSSNQQQQQNLLSVPSTQTGNKPQQKVSPRNFANESTTSISSSVGATTSEQKDILSTSTNLPQHPNTVTQPTSALEQQQQEQNVLQQENKQESTRNTPPSSVSAVPQQPTTTTSSSGHPQVPSLNLRLGGANFLASLAASGGRNLSSTSSQQQQHHNPNNTSPLASPTNSSYTNFSQMMSVSASGGLPPQNSARNANPSSNPSGGGISNKQQPISIPRIGGLSNFSQQQQQQQFPSNIRSLDSARKSSVIPVAFNSARQTFQQQQQDSSPNFHNQQQQGGSGGRSQQQQGGSGGRSQQQNPNINAASSVVAGGMTTTTATGGDSNNYIISSSSSQYNQQLRKNEQFQQMIMMRQQQMMMNNFVTPQQRQQQQQQQQFQYQNQNVVPAGFPPQQQQQQQQIQQQVNQMERTRTADMLLMALQKN